MHVTYIQRWLLTPWVSFVVNVEVQLLPRQVVGNIQPPKVLRVSILLYVGNRFYTQLIYRYFCNLQILNSPYHKPVSAVTSKRGRSSLSGKNSSSRFGRIISFRKTKKIKLSLCISLVFCASRNVSFNDHNHILKFFTEGFENLPSSFFLIPKVCYQVLSSASGCIFYFPPFGKFHLDIRNKMANNSGTALPHKIGFDITNDRFC